MGWSQDEDGNWMYGTEEGYWLYSKQPVEESAREYARERVNEIMVLLYETTEDGYILVG